MRVNRPESPQRILQNHEERQRADGDIADEYKVPHAEPLDPSVVALSRDFVKLFSDQPTCRSHGSWHSTLSSASLAQSSAHLPPIDLAIRPVEIHDPDQIVLIEGVQPHRVEKVPQFLHPERTRLRIAVSEPQLRIERCGVRVLRAQAPAALSLVMHSLVHAVLAPGAPLLAPASAFLLDLVSFVLALLAERTLDGPAARMLTVNTNAVHTPSHGVLDRPVDRFCAGGDAEDIDHVLQLLVCLHNLLQERGDDFCIRFITHQGMDAVLVELVEDVRRHAEWDTDHGAGSP
eukprot:3091341-Rhodomonas_salina.2